MEPLIVVLSFLATVGLALVAAYVALWILLFVMQRAILPTARRVVERRGVKPVYVAVDPTDALTSSAPA